MAILTWLFRLLLILILVRLVLRAVFGQAARRRPGGAFGQRPGARPAERLGGTLVRCRQCGTHVPESHALADGPNHFCSTACRDTQASSARRAG